MVVLQNAKNTRIFQKIKFDEEESEERKAQEY
jgi:hypothetical protein